MLNLWPCYLHALMIYTVLFSITSSSALAVRSTSFIFSFQLTRMYRKKRYISVRKHRWARELTVLFHSLFTDRMVLKNISDELDGFNIRQYENGWCGSECHKIILFVVPNINVDQRTLIYVLHMVLKGFPILVLGWDSTRKCDLLYINKPQLIKVLTLKIQYAWLNTVGISMYFCRILHRLSQNSIWRLQHTLLLWQIVLLHTLC